MDELRYYRVASINLRCCRISHDVSDVDIGSVNEVVSLLLKKR